jgi:hypothetical protein
MFVWVLERFCGDDASYDFVNVFAERDNAINYVLRTYPDDWRVQNETPSSTEIWHHQMWEQPRKTRLDVATWVVTRCEVK